MVDSLKPTSQNESTLSRWSRLKREQLAEKESLAKNSDFEVIAQENRAISDSSIRDGDAVAAIDPGAGETKNAEALPSLDEVSLEKDFTPFMQAKVPEALKRQALKTLFKDPHFNTMDGLDTYIDDYTKFEPISPEELAGLSSWKSIMKPLEQVVTPGGYAVDVESEEGKAVLAAREALAFKGEVSAQVSSESAIESPSPATSSRPLPAEEVTNARYGKRVSDFKFEDTPLHVEETAPVPGSKDNAIDDIR